MGDSVYSGGYKDFQWKTIYRNIGDGSTNLLKANKELVKMHKIACYKTKNTKLHIESPNLRSH